MRFENGGPLAGLEDRMGEFSKGQRAIARFILDSYDKAAFITAGRLARMVGVSESTVVRFATELGFEGYSHMQRKLQEIIRNKLTTAQRMEVTQDRLEGHDLIKTVMLADTEKIRSTLENIDRQSFDGAVSAILNAKNVYVVGVRSSSALAGFLAFYLNLMRENVKLVSASEISETVEQVMRAGAGDLVIGISFPRYSRRTLQAMGYARARGAEVVAITDIEDSPICAHATHTLLAKCDMSLFVDSLVAPLSLINALIVAVGLKRGETLSEAFRSLERLWTDCSVYEIER